jgi:hypothetical protein
MRAALLRLGLAGSLALLGACNMVVTKDPVFARADGAGAPQMRPGVWNGGPAADCQFDQAKPLQDWPACANGFLVKRDGTFAEFSNQAGKQVLAPTDVVLAAGEPRIMQLHVTSGADDPLMPSAYFYAGLEATKRDDQGRIVAARAWIVVCGPPRPPDAAVAKGAGDQSHLGTLHPFAGLTMDKDGNNCSPVSKAALRSAAHESFALTAPKDISAATWVRDGEK